jgi:hypothetical protein
MYSHGWRRFGDDAAADFTGLAKAFAVVLSKMVLAIVNFLRQSFLRDELQDCGNLNCGVVPLDTLVPLQLVTVAVAGMYKWRVLL